MTPEAVEVSILGTGKMGSAIGQALTRAGYRVHYGSRVPETGRLRCPFAASVRSYAEAVVAAQRVILAVPWAFALDTVRSLNAPLEGRVLIDVTNPLSADFSSLVVGGADSAAEQIARSAPGARVVKAFNGIVADRFLTPLSVGPHAQAWFCGDDATALQDVSTLIRACGYEPIACGPLSQARYLEAVAMLWLQLAFWQDWGPEFEIAVRGQFPVPESG